MAWVTRAYEPSTVDAAGRLLAEHYEVESPDDFPAEVLDVVTNWRRAHAFPLNTFQIGLRRRAVAVYSHAAVVQRLKRISSTAAKLRKYRRLTLSEMQDMGGCRAVVDSSAHVMRIRNSFLASGLKHRLVRQDDYIDKPKQSGYRGIHLIYEYHSDRQEIWNGLKIEVQLRSRIQHAWATAVEVVGLFRNESLKTGIGSAEWLQFFKLVGAAFAQAEGLPLVPKTPTDPKILKGAVRQMADHLAVSNTLDSLGYALDVTGDTDFANARYFLLVLNAVAGTVSIKGYSSIERTRALRDAEQAELEVAGLPGRQAMLAAAENLNDLKRGYPNWYLDTNTFLGYLHEVVT